MQTLQYVVLTDGTHLGPGLAWPQHGKSSGELEMPHCVHCNARKIWSLYRYIPYRTAPVLCCVHPNHFTGRRSKNRYENETTSIHRGSVCCGRAAIPWWYSIVGLGLQGRKALGVTRVIGLDSRGGSTYLGHCGCTSSCSSVLQYNMNNNDMVRVCVFVCVCVAGMYGESVVYICTIPISSCSIIYEGNLLTSTTIERDTVYVQQSCNAVLLYTQAKRVGRHSTRDVYQTSTIKFPIKPPTIMYAVLLINAEHHYAYIKYEQIYTTNSYEIPFRIRQM